MATEETGLSAVERLMELHGRTTPGEWHIGDTYQAEAGRHYVVRLSTGVPVALTGPEGYMVEQSKADGTFIAAAHNDLPEIARQFREMRAWIDGASHKPSCNFSIQQKLLGTFSGVLTGNCTCGLDAILGVSP